MRSISNALYERECYTYSDYRSLIRPVESRNVGIISIYQLYIYIRLNIIISSLVFTVHRSNFTESIVGEVKDRKLVRL